MIVAGSFEAVHSKIIIPLRPLKVESGVLKPRQAAKRVEDAWFR
jgi:hypothetical protein